MLTVDLVTGCIAVSKLEAKRLIQQGAIEVDKVKVGKIARIKDGSILQIGKRQWEKICLPKFRAEVYKFDNRDNQEHFLRQCTQLSEAAIQQSLKEDFGTYIQLRENKPIEE